MKNLTYVLITKYPDACLALEGKMTKAHASTAIQKGAFMTKRWDVKNQIAVFSTLKPVEQATQLFPL